MNGPPRSARGDDAYAPLRPFVTPRDESRPRRSPDPDESRRHAPAPPFSGRGGSESGEASTMVRVRDESAIRPRDHAGGRSVARRWQAIEIGFEEWGQGALVLVGMPRQSAPAVERRRGVQPPPPEDTAAWASRREAAPSAGARSDDTSDEIETVALALETIALRVRVGEFRVRGLVPGMTDAAILAATLASVLAPRP